MTSRNFALLAVALPVLLIAGGIARSELRVRDRPSFRFAVEGYDPRDLLRGRYLLYRVKLERGPSLDGCDEAAGDVCELCVVQGAPGQSASVRAMHWRSRPAACDAVLDADVYTEPQRHYIAEQAAPELEKRFIEAARAGQAFVVVTLDAEGMPHVKHLELFGEPLP